MNLVHGRLSTTERVWVVVDRIDDGLRYSLLPIERWSSLVARGAATTQKKTTGEEMRRSSRWYKGTMTLLR